jgi:hypothetical protein
MRSLLHFGHYFKLNLKKCENTVIGEPDKGVKGISGGERRRLAFGCEVNSIKTKIL